MSQIQYKAIQNTLSAHVYLRHPKIISSRRRSIGSLVSPVSVCVRVRAHN